MNKTTIKSLHKYQWHILIATWVAYAGYYFGRKAIFVVKNDLQLSLSINPIQLAHLFTAYYIFYALGQFSSAYFGRKTGPKVLLLVGIALSGLCNFVFGITNSYYTILLFLAVNGFAQGTGWPGCIGSLAQWLNKESRGRVLGVWSTCYQLGSIAAKGYAAYLAATWGWQSSFFGATIILIIVWLVVWRLHPGTPESIGFKEVESENDLEHIESNSSKWSKDMVTTVVTMGFIYFCIKFLRYALWSWTPYFFKANFGFKIDEAGYLSTLFEWGGFLGVLFAGYVSDKFFKGHRALLATLMMLGMTLGFAGLYIFGVNDVFIFSICLGIIGFMLFGPDSLISGVGAIDATSKKQALTAAGIINGCGSLGPVFQEEIIGFMYQTFNHQLAPIFAVLLLVAVIGVVAMFALYLASKKGHSNL